MELEVVGLFENNHIKIKFIKDIVSYKSHLLIKGIPFICCARIYTFDDTKKVLSLFPSWKKDSKINLNIKVGDMIEYTFLNKK